MTARRAWLAARDVGSARRESKPDPRLGASSCLRHARPHRILSRGRAGHADEHKGGFQRSQRGMLGPAEAQAASRSAASKAAIPRSTESRAASGVVCAHRLRRQRQPAPRGARRAAVGLVLILDASRPRQGRIAEIGAPFARPRQGRGRAFGRGCCCAHGAGVSRAAAPIHDCLHHPSPCPRPRRLAPCCVTMRCSTLLMRALRTPQPSLPVACL
jgi:hypothetical protein